MSSERRLHTCFPIIPIPPVPHITPIPPYTHPSLINKIPEFVPGHVSWHFWYKHHGWSNSFFGRIVCNQEGIWFDAAIQTGITTTAALIATVIAGGGVPTTNTLVWSIKFLFLGIIWTIILSLVYVFALKPKKD